MIPAQFLFAGGRRPRQGGFTLIELLVVIVIIGILASISLPVLRGFGEANTSAAANRQILDDLGFARLRAMNERTTVFLVFLTTAVANSKLLQSSSLSAQEKQLAARLAGGQYVSYTLFTRRSVGAQPGQEQPRYLAEWISLPEGFLFATNKFDLRLSAHTDPYLRSLPTDEFPFPNADSPLKIRLPYIAFNSKGQLLTLTRGDEIIAIARGSVMTTPGQVAVADVVMTPPDNYTNNWIRINALTGRAHIERPQLQ